MRERIFILVSVIVIVVALIGLNAVSAVRLEREPEREDRPNRSTFNSGATGTRAFYEFLRSTGRRAVRWQEKPSELLKPNRTAPQTFVIIGKTRRIFEEEEIKNILEWTTRGGRLVVIDRDPPAELVATAGSWSVSSNLSIPFQLSPAKPENVNEMTHNVPAAKPVQPTVLVAGVNSVMPSKYASSITVEFSPETKASPKPAQTPIRRLSSRQEHQEVDAEEPGQEPPRRSADPHLPPPPKSMPADDASEPQFQAPVAHLLSDEKNILVDYPYGAGRIIYLSDPYIVSNGGISLVDNLQLATNIVDSGGLIAFDEFHQGYGARGNPLLNYVEETPIPAILAQLALLAAFLIYTRGRRFARPLPLPNPDRRSKLEYVSAMAELGRRARAYDLAIENIYGRFRRDIARLVGIDNSIATTRELAARLAERSKFNKAELENLMRECEDAIHGEKISDKKALKLIAKIREIQQKLGLTRHGKI